MGFWTIVLIVIFVFGWIDQLRGGSKRKTKEHFEQTPRPRQPTPVDQEPILPRGAETQRLTSASFTGVCQEINRFTTSARESITLHMQVEEATKQLQHEMMVERVLIEKAIEHSEFLLQADKKRSAMSPAHRVLFDEAKLKFEKIHEDKNSSSSQEVPDYRRPDFSMTNGAYDDAMALAIRDKISSLKQERDDYIAAANKKLRDPRLAAYFVEIFERRGGPETAKSLKKAAPSVVLGGTKRENATTENWKVVNALATPSIEETESKTDCNLPSPRETAAKFALRETMASIAATHPQTRIAIMNWTKTIDPPYLLHFTQVENIPSIMHNGLCPVSTLTEASTPFHANDCLRLDGHKDAVSLSIAHPNDRMFSKYRWQDLQQKWAVLVLDPSILWLLPTAFNRHNAADKRMSRLSREERMSVEAFDGMFQPPNDLPSRKENRLLPFDPTDVQAELLVFCVIKSFFVTGVVFGDADSLNACTSGLTKRRLSIHSEGRGFFGARTYARKTGWTY